MIPQPPGWVRHLKLILYAIVVGFVTFVLLDQSGYRGFDIVITLVLMLGMLFVGYSLGLDYCDG